MPESDLDLLTEAAREAGKIARRFWRKKPEIWDKPGEAGPVTEADLAVNRMLEAELRGSRPDYGWLSEESPDQPERLSRERTFIIDPIDGTRAFIDGDTSFAHSLAIAEAGEVRAAVVYLPAREELFAAESDRAATLNGDEIRASVRTDMAGATLLTTRPNLAPELWKDSRPPEAERVFRASIAWRLCLVAQGRFDAMLTLRPTWEWDSAGGELIARQAGATVTDRHGSPLRFNAPDPRSAGVIAAPHPLWSVFRDTLAP